jgi:hypothetical protein
MTGLLFHDALTERRTRISMLARCWPVDGVAGVSEPSVGIDIMASDGAPCDELIRLQFDRNGPSAISDDVARGFFEALLPSVIQDGEVLTIRHDFADTGIISGCIPCDANADCSCELSHDEFSSVVVVANPTDTNAVRESICAGGGDL